MRKREPGQATKDDPYCAMCDYWVDEGTPPCPIHHPEACPKEEDHEATD